MCLNFLVHIYAFIHIAAFLLTVCISIVVSKDRAKGSLSPSDVPTHLVVSPHNQYIQPCAKILMYGAADVLELMKSHDKEMTLCDLVDILKQSALEEAEEVSLNIRRGS